MKAKEENWVKCTNCTKGKYGEGTCPAHTHDSPSGMGCYEGKAIG